MSHAGGLVHFSVTAGKAFLTWKNSPSGVHQRLRFNVPAGVNPPSPNTRKACFWRAGRTSKSITPHAEGKVGLAMKLPTPSDFWPGRQQGASSMKGKNETGASMILRKDWLHGLDGQGH